MWSLAPVGIASRALAIRLENTLACEDVQWQLHLIFLAREVFWQLLVEGIVAPGMDSSNLNLPFFHITEHGRAILASVEPPPYDPTGYLAHVRRRVANPDPTVIAYLGESLETFRKDNRVASPLCLASWLSACSCYSATA
jgi:hypothetical protein